MSDPVQLFSFTDWQASHPHDQPPGDRLDAEFNGHRAAINDVENKLGDIRRTDGKLKNGIVTQDALDPTAFDAIEAGVIAAVTPLVTSAGGSSLAAQASATAASISAAGAEGARLDAMAAAAILAADSSGALAQIAAAEAAAIALKTTADTRAEDVINAANDAEGWGAYSYSWAQVSWRWAEYMEGPIPADILAIMGISGDHWSSRFWATAAADASGSAASDAASAAAAAEAAQDAAEAAAAAAEEVSDLYLGDHATAPGTDNDGDALQVGAMYWNTTSNQLSVWDGAVWIAVTTPTGVIPASGVTFTPTGGVSSTNVQGALVELDAEKLSDAPSDGATYGRRNGGWTSTSSPTIGWDAVTGKPATFPPSPHVHPTSEITGLDAALADRATDAELAAEVSARTSADTTLQTNINTEATTRANADTALASADTALDGRLDVVEAALPGKVNEAPNDGKQYARKSLAWAEIVGGATISPTPPVSPVAQQLWWDSDTGRLYIYYNDGNTSQWVQLNAVPGYDGLVQKAGDKMTGDLEIEKASPGILLDKQASGQTSGIYGQLAGVHRWRLALGDGQADAANAGSDFTLRRYDDAGVQIDEPVRVTRIDGSMKLAATLTVAPASGAAAIQLNKPASGQNNYIIGQMGGNNRWALRFGDSTAEAGANSGSDLSLNRYSDAGSTIDTVLTIKRSTGVMTANLAMPAVLAHRAGQGQSSIGTNVWTKINLLSLASNIGGWTRDGSNNLVVPKDGVYLVGAQAQIVAPSALSALMVGFGVNSITVPTSVGRTYNAVANNINHNVSTQKIVTLAAGDYVSLLTYCVIAGGLVSDGIDGTFLWATMVAAT